MYPGVHAASHPDKPAVIMAGSGLSLTYRELDEASNQLSHLFWDRGLRNGDGIALLMDNAVDYLVVTWAAQRSGLYFTAISTRLTAGEIAYIVDDSGAQIVVTDPAHLAAVDTALAECAAVHTRLLVGGEADGWEELASAVAGWPTSEIPGQLEGGALLYSSGTTGRPKGVKFPLPRAPIGSQTSVVLGTQRLYGVGPESVYLSPAPLYHAAPLHFCMTINRIGATAVIMEHFDPVEFLELIERHRVTHTQVVPTMFVRLLKLPEAQRTAHDLSSLEVVIHAAAPCPVPVKQQMFDWWGPIIHEYYAGTEGNGSCIIGPTDWLAHPGSVGRPLAGEVHILDEDGIELPPGESGAIWFGGGGRFEYHNDPEKTRSAYNDRGWSTLGDVGYLDEDGWLFLTDRKAFMIISGGVNIYPQEIEDALALHPKVFDAAVIGAPDPEMGESVLAVIQPADDVTPRSALGDELRAYLRDRIAHYKIPRDFDFVEELPRTPTGKLVKGKLRERYQ
jgi:acyl-CoA synthetase (AMP-forming)/AMP-acid ligase II